MSTISGFANSLNKFLGWNKARTSYYIRIKKSAMLRIRKRKFLAAKKLFKALQAIGFVWVPKVGAWKAEIKPMIWKRFKQQKRPQYSYFPDGLDYI